MAVLYGNLPSDGVILFPQLFISGKSDHFLGCNTVWTLIVITFTKKVIAHSTTTLIEANPFVVAMIIYKVINTHTAHATVVILNDSIENTHLTCRF